MDDSGDLFAPGDSAPAQNMAQDPVQNPAQDPAQDPASAVPEAPLAARMRPRTMEEFAGQRHIVGEGRLLRRAIEADRIESIILSGPPGTGKTTLARIIAGATKSRFEQINAVEASVADLRKILAGATHRRIGSLRRAVTAHVEGAPHGVGQNG